MSSIWLDEDEGDPKGVEAVLEGRVKIGAVTLNEMRDSLGLDPYANAAADRPMVLTATGYVPIEANAGGQRGSETVQSESGPQKYLLAKVYNPEEPRVPKRNVGGGQWTKEGISEAASNANDLPDIPSSSHVDSSVNGGSQSDARNVRIAAASGLRCDGFAGGCQSGGTYGTNAMYRIRGLNLCMDCAVKMLGIENESSNEKVLTLSPFSIQGK